MNASPPPSQLAEPSLRERWRFVARNPFPHRWTLGLFYAEKMAAIHRLLPHTAPRRVLEIGGGRSGLTRLCFPHARVTSVDISLPELRAAPAGAERVACDAVRLPFPDGVFDAVTLFDVVEHLEDDRAAAREAERVLAPGGTLLVSTPTRAFRYPRWRWMRRWLPSEQTILDRWGHVRIGYELAELRALWPGLSLVAARHFMNGCSAVAHDVAFADWSERRRLCGTALLLPLTLLGFALQRPSRGIMVAATFTKGSA